MSHDAIAKLAHNVVVFGANRLKYPRVGEKISYHEDTHVVGWKDPCHLRRKVLSPGMQERSATPASFSIHVCFLDHRSSNIGEEE
jgi:hypothetical protein